MSSKAKLNTRATAPPAPRANSSNKRTSAARKRASPAQPATNPAQPTTKRAMLIALLSDRGGQDISQLSKALGWLPHTVRAAFVGLKKVGFEIERIPSDTGRTGRFRIVGQTGGSR